MIKRKNIKRGIGALTLVAMLASGCSIKNKNEDNDYKMPVEPSKAIESNIEYSDINKNDFLKENSTPLIIEPIRIVHDEDDEVELVIPIGYLLYCIDGNTENLAGAKYTSDEMEHIVGPKGHSMDNFVGIHYSLGTILKNAKYIRENIGKPDSLIETVKPKLVTYHKATENGNETTYKLMFPEGYMVYDLVNKELLPQMVDATTKTVIFLVPDAESKKDYVGINPVYANTLISAGMIEKMVESYSYGSNEKTIG